MSDEDRSAESEHYRLVALTSASETGERPHARVVLTDDGKERTPEASGNGPVDAAFKAIESVVEERRRDAALFGQCHHQRHRIAGRGDGAAAEGGRIVNGAGADPDIVVASAKAYITR